MALPAARAYARIAPSATHAQHMPSHIFTRLGMWKESIESNLTSAQTAQAWIAKTHAGATAFDALHATDYLEYAYLQTGQDAKARELVDNVARVTSFDVPQFAAGYALAAVPARHALERRAWKEAAALTPQPATFPWAKYPYAEAIVHFARAVGGARTGDLEMARHEVAKLAEIQASLKGQKGFDWATQVEIQRRAAASWLARAEKKDAEALALMRSAADLEDSTDKHPVTPGSILPAREQLAHLQHPPGRTLPRGADHRAAQLLGSDHRPRRDRRHERGTIPAPVGLIFSGAQHQGGCLRTWDLTIRVPSALSTHDTERSIVARQDGPQPPGRRRHRARAGPNVRAAAARPRNLLPGRGSCPRSPSAGHREDRRLAQP